MVVGELVFGERQSPRRRNSERIKGGYHLAIAMTNGTYKWPKQVALSVLLGHLLGLNHIVLVETKYGSTFM